MRFDGSEGARAFAAELERFLPADMPHRDVLAAKGAQHLAMIEEANRQFNLTRITDPRDAAIKHVVDSVMPWHCFTGSRRVLDAGSGAGFPGIPLAIVLPEIRFTLSESIQKKARFAGSAITNLGLTNAAVSARRAEEIMRDEAIDIITARALAPLGRALALFAPALRRGTRLLLYKGPDVHQEISEAASDARRRHLHMRVVMRYELPEGEGSRNIVEIAI